MAHKGTNALKELLSKDRKFVKYSAKASTTKVTDTEGIKSSYNGRSASALAKKQPKSPAQTGRVVNKVESTKDDAQGTSSGGRRYFIENREGEAVELIKASILSRPQVMRSPNLQGSPDDKQRYQINDYVHVPADQASPLASRLSELSPFAPASDSERGTPSGGDSELWSPASAMRNARQHTKTNDIVPSTKGSKRTTKSAKRSLKMLEK